MKRQIPVHRWPRHAWSVGIAGTDDLGPTGWDGHLLTHLVHRDHRGRRTQYLIDATANQLSRPEHGLHVLDTVAAVDGSFLAGDEHVIFQPNETVVWYQRMIGASQYLHTRAWRHGHPLELPTNLADALRAVAHEQPPTTPRGAQDDVRRR